MTDAFMADETLRKAYELKEGESFASAFSVVSIENILFYIIAACCHVLECLFDAFKADVDTKIESAVVASVAWYYKMARAFQYGDSLVFDERTQQYQYAAVDEVKQFARYVAVRDRGTSIQILVSGDKGGKPTPLSNDVLTAFKHYMNRVKIAGIILNIASLPADKLTIAAHITIDPLILTTDGTRIADGSRPVEDAINGYLSGIVYGGTFNKTKLTDAIQAVQGVLDVELGECRASTEGDYQTIQNNNYTAAGGSFTAEGLTNTIRYVV